MSAGAIVVAAGTSSRMGGVDKIMAHLCGRPLVTHSLEAFEGSSLVARVVLVVPPAGVDAHRDLVTVRGYGKVEVVPGGERRQDSVRMGWMPLAPSSGPSSTTAPARASTPR